MRKEWTEAERKLLHECFPHMRTEDVAAKLNRSYTSVAQRAKVEGLRKTPEFLSQYRYKKGHDDKRGRFQKGFTPWNKGIRFVSGGRSIHTRFSKGNLPPNTMHDGAIVIRRCSTTGKPYQYIRVRMGLWDALHRQVYIQHFGPIPKGMIVAFKNRDTMDVRPENLELITRTENMRRNSIQRFPEELKKTIRTLHKLKRTIHEKQDH
jgi:hypothetical protein